MTSIEKTIEESQDTCTDKEIGINPITGNDVQHHLEPISPTAAVEDNTEIKLEQGNERKQQIHECNNDEELPIDKGWAWVVLAGITVLALLFGGIIKNFGIIFVAIQDRFGSSASLTSSLVTTQRLTNSFTSLITMTVGMQFTSNRIAVILGALILTISNIVSAFATDVRILFASIGVLEGVAKGFIIPTITVSLLEYFNKRRGLAVGLAFSGSSLGGLIFAPIFAELLDNIGYTRTLLIVAGMTFSFLVTGALLRPIKSFERQSLKHNETNGNTKDETDIESRSDTGKHESSLESIQNKSNEQNSFLCKLKAGFDMKVFKTFVFPVFLLMAAMLATTTDLLVMFLAPFSDDIGLTADQIGILMSVLAGVGMLSRIICALVADRECVKRTTLLAVLSMMAGITAHCARFFKSFSLLLVMAVFLGLTCEIYNSMYPVILVEYLTLSKTKSCMGFTVMTQGIAVASTYPLVGWLRDTIGNYYASYHCLGTMSFIGALCAFALPYVHRRSKKKSNHHIHVEKNTEIVTVSS
ncbi:monocarboxylate transporter 12-like isoform X1 [Mercenaria mercenaria]|uniref:monocarboxylate transporter 12-like isoform X1 n=1 Tax=Mercenaria mercenaria TaxID=6596 RepID=UPI00234EC2FA|nr:monocarboxylate transporter 12-like isoform X1 [Mercenaria mercenaria]XP_053404196.1 monocarboxylate transporter 12-like isoform X1 [Mercenaria mercenaria]